MTVVTCSRCTTATRELRHEIRRNEKRLRAGLPVDTTAIDTLKTEKAECAANGHHDNTAGARARWGNQ